MVIFIACGFNLSALIVFENLSSNLKLVLKHNSTTLRPTEYAYMVSMSSQNLSGLGSLKPCRLAIGAARNQKGLLVAAFCTCLWCLVQSGWSVGWFFGPRPGIVALSTCESQWELACQWENNEASKAKHLRLAERSQCSLQANRSLYEACKAKSMKLAARSQWGLQATANEACN